jgi:hypothetical protein
MKIVDNTEAEKRKFKQQGHATVFTEAIRKLEVLQSLEITKEEWPNKKYDPHIMAPVWYRLGWKVKMRTWNDGSGWTLTRIQ